MLKPLPAALAFIDRYRLQDSGLEEATWRTNAFRSTVWECLFGDTRTNIDFRVALADGSLLTDARHRKLLESIKRFLCFQTHPASTGTVVLAPLTARLRIAIALQVLDYFLLRSDQFGLASHGFGQVTSNDLMMLLDAITSTGSPKAGIYEPQRRMLDHLTYVQVPDIVMCRIPDDHKDAF